MRQVTFGKLTCYLTGGDDNQGGGTGPLVVLLHGFGAPGNDLVGLEAALTLPPQVRILYPAAPIALGGPYGDGRAWWMLDVAALAQRALREEEVDRRAEVPEGLAQAREQLRACLDEACKALSPPDDGLVLGGFSQGSMLSCDLALHDDRPLAGLVLLSSTLIAQDVWVPRMPKRAGLKVFQSHGSSDPVLPLIGATQLAERLAQAGVVGDMIEFTGGHEIPMPVLKALSSFLHHVLPLS